LTVFVWLTVWKADGQLPAAVTWTGVFLSLTIPLCMGSAYLLFRFIVQISNSNDCCSGCQCPGLASKAVDCWQQVLQLRDERVPPSAGWLWPSVSAALLAAFMALLGQRLDAQATGRGPATRPAGGQLRLSHCGCCTAGGW
jgi:hypothetical protein